MLPGDDWVVSLDTAQYETGQGPCLDAAYEHRTVRVDDFATEQRWPKFCQRARELGAGSLLSLQLFVRGDNMAALNLYSSQAGAFADESEQIGLIFASHAAVALAGARTQEPLRIAVDSRDIIGQAKGILMERFKITADEAFRVLTKASSESNMKLRDVAERFAGTGQGPSQRHTPSE